MANERPSMRTVLGTVVSDKMDKTITVREERLVKHPRYGKYVRRSTSYKAHDERNEAVAGDRVEIVATRPISKSKHWRLLRVVTRFGERHEAVTSTTSASEADVAPEPESGEEASS